MKCNEERETQDNFIQKTFINLRPLALSAAALATGAGFCYASLFHGVSLLFALLTLIPFAVYVIVAKKKVKAMLCFFLALTFLGLGMGGFALRIESYHSQAFSEGEYVLTGEIAHFTEGENFAKLVLKDVSVDGESLDGNVQANLYLPYRQGKEGMKIRFTATLKPLGSAYRYHVFHAERVLENIKYTATLQEIPVVIGEGSNPFTLVRNQIKAVLYDNLSKDQASVAYAMTTGNSDGIEEGLLTSVRYGGVAHLFAVSGSHIGIVYGALSYLFKRLKTPKAVSILLSLTAAFLFSGVCGFSPSSLRAFFICFTQAVCSLLSVRADGMEGAGFSCGMILLLNPVYLFSIGFQLSMAAYIAIVTLAPSLQRLCKPVYAKIPFLKEPVNSVLIMFSVQLFLFPVMLNAFGYVSVWGLLLNLFILPLFSLYFPILLTGVLLSCIFPAAAFIILFLPGGILSLFIEFFAAVDFSTLLVQGFFFGTIAVVAFYSILLLLSGRINIKIRQTMPLACLLSFIIFADVFLGGFSLPVECRITQNCYYDNFCCALIETKEANVLLVNQKANFSRVQNFLFSQGKDLDAIIISAEDVNACANSVLALPVQKIYVRSGETLEVRTKEVVAEDAFSIGGVQYNFKRDNALSFAFGGYTGVFNATAHGEDFSLFPSEERDGLIFTINRGIFDKE